MCFVIPHLITDRCVPTEPSLQPDWYFSKVLKSCPLSTVCAEGITPVYHMDGSAVQDDFNPYSSSLSRLEPGLGSAGAMRSCVCCLQTVIFRPMSHPKGSTGLHFCTKPLVSILPKRPFPFRPFPSPTNSHTVVFTASLIIFLGFPVNIFHACALIYFHFLVHLFIRGQTRVITHGWRPEDSSPESVLAFHHTAPRHRTQIFCLGGS